MQILFSLIEVLIQLILKIIWKDILVEEIEKKMKKKTTKSNNDENNNSSNHNNNNENNNSSNNNCSNNNIISKDEYISELPESDLIFISDNLLYIVQNINNVIFYFSNITTIQIILLVISLISYYRLYLI